MTKIQHQQENGKSIMEFGVAPVNLLAAGSNFISSRSEDFRVFSYVIWWTEYEKNTEKKSLKISLTLKIYS